MGGGDLNLKKSWHPSTLRNIERVWKAEQKHEAEQQKIEQLQKELAAERAREEIQAYAEDKGVVRKRDERLDWMYQGPASLVSRDDYLMGRKIDKTFEIMEMQESGQTESAADKDGPASLFRPSASTSDVTVDLATKIREDPLFAIMKREKEQRKNLLTNPVKMRQLKKMLEKSIHDDKKTKSKKSKKSKRKHTSSSSSSSSSEEEEPDFKKSNRRDEKPNGRDEKPNRRDEKPNRRDEKPNRRDEKPDRRDEKPNSRDEKPNSRDEKPDRRDEKPDRRDEKPDRRDEKPNSRDEKPNSRDEKPYGHDEKLNRRDEKLNRRDEKPTSRSRKEIIEHSRSPPSSQEKYERDRKSSYYHDIRRNGKYDDRSYSSRDRNDKKMENSRHSKEYAEKRNDGHQNTKSRQRPEPQKKLSSVDKEKLRQEMMENAKWRENQRKKNVERYIKEGELEDNIGDGNASEFIRPMLSKAAESGTVEGRVKQKIFTIQRRRGDMDKNFARR